MWDLSSPTRDWTRGPLHWKPLDHQESLKTSNSLQISDSWLLTRYQNCHFVSSLEQEVKTGKNWRLLFMDELGIRNLLHDTPPKTPNPGSSSSSCIDWQACFRHVTAPIRPFVALLSDCWMKQIPVLLSGFSLTHTKPSNDLAVASTFGFPLQVLLMSVFKTLLSLLNPGSPPQILTCRLLHAQPRFLSPTRHSVLLKCPLNSLGPKHISSGIYGPRARYLFTTLDRLQGPRAFSLLVSVLAKPATFACPERLPESRFSELNRSSVLRWEGNGTPLQCSCLGNPMNGGAWWPAVHGVSRVRHNWATSLSLFTVMHWRRKWQPTPVFLPGESQGRGSLVGCRLWGCTESDTTDAT